jgi:hypothetical protein
MLLVIVPGKSSYSAPPLQGNRVTVYLDGGGAYSTYTSYLVSNGKGTYAVRAYFPAGTFDANIVGRSSVKAFISYRGGIEMIANLIVYVNPNGSALLVGAVTGS